MKKHTSKTHDAFVKELLHHKEAAIDFIKHVLQNDIVALLDLDRLTYTDTSYTNKKMEKLVSDVVFQIPFRSGHGVAEVTVLIEHKSYKDRKTPFQLLSYLAAGYLQQLKHGKTPSVIIPIVYYHGKQLWTLPAIPEYFSALHPGLKKYIPHFHTEMVSIRNIDLNQIGGISTGILGAAMVVQKSAHDSQFAIGEFARIVNSFSSEDQKSFFETVILYIFENGLLHHSLIPSLTKQLSTDMKTKTMNLREYFIAEGFEKGKQEGRQEGRQDGIQQGSLQSRYEFARKLILRHMPLEEICELSDLTIEEVKAIEKGM